MSHRNARLTFHGRRLLAARVESGMPVAHVAKAMGISRQCAHRWVARYAAEGEAGVELQLFRGDDFANGRLYPSREAALEASPPPPTCRTDLSCCVPETNAAPVLVELGAKPAHSF